MTESPEFVAYRPAFGDDECMERPTGKLPPPSDPFGETLHLLQLTGTLYCQSELTAPWGIDVPEIEGCMTFQVISQGSCWLEIEGSPPRLLQQGSLSLIPSGKAHCLRSDLEAAPLPLFEIPVEKVSERYEMMRHGGGGALTQATYGVVRFDQLAAQRLIRLLPQVLQIDTWEGDLGLWLQSTLRLIAKEAKMLRPGGETIITRLADVLVIQAIRSWLDTAQEADQGWLAALKHPQLGRALAAIHRAPEKDWSVTSLAKEAGMSRSAFSARFSDKVGEPVMRYLTTWRLQLARKALESSDQPLADIAEAHGYSSEAAFSRVFKKQFGFAPGTIRKAKKKGA